MPWLVCIIITILVSLYYYNYFIVNVQLYHA